jgi:hypothetical protein
MSKRNYAAKEIIIKLREVEVLCGQGKVQEAVRQMDITESRLTTDRGKNMTT